MAVLPVTLTYPQNHAAQNKSDRFAHRVRFRDSAVPWLALRARCAPGNPPRFAPAPGPAH
jgi:hypothetical protein